MKIGAVSRRWSAESWWSHQYGLRSAVNHTRKCVNAPCRKIKEMKGDALVLYRSVFGASFPAHLVTLVAPFFLRIAEIRSSLHFGCTHYRLQPINSRSRSIIPHINSYFSSLLAHPAHSATMKAPSMLVIAALLLACVMQAHAFESRFFDDCATTNMRVVNQRR